jgi:hypothetical protein
MSIHTQRTQVRRLLDDSSPADAPTVYYTLFHDPARSVLTVQTDETGRETGFVGVFQTGIDLFRPLITLCCRDAGGAADLLQQALMSGRPYLLFARQDQLALVGGSLRVENSRLLHIHQLDLRQFQPVMNVLVQHKSAPDGTPRCVIESGGLQAMAGVNWQSPGFAEIYVYTDADARQRGWGLSVVSALTQVIVKSGRIPLYLVEADNDPSRRLAEKLGYVDSGGRQVFADVVYLGHPGQR